MITKWELNNIIQQINISMREKYGAGAPELDIQGFLENEPMQVILAETRPSVFNSVIHVDYFNLCNAYPFLDAEGIWELLTEQIEDLMKGSGL